LFFDDNFEYQVAQFIFWIKNKKTNTKLINLYHKSSKTTPDSIIRIISPLLRNAIPGVMLGCGTNSNFAQLNRNRPESDLIDNFTYSIHPQEHASDNITLVENLQGQGYTVESAKHFSNGKGIWISPVTIQRRYNANKENYEQTSNFSSLPAQVDSRLMSLLGASWAAASIKYLSATGVKGITYFETVGERGIIQGDFPSRWPESFKSVKGMIFPVFHLFKFVFDNKAFEANASLSSDALTVDILTLSHGIDLKMILMNFTSGIQSVRLNDIYGEFSMKQLNARNFAEAASDLNWYQNESTTQIDPVEKLMLEPFSLSFLEGKVRT
jgi:D-apionolactonase